MCVLQRIESQVSLRHVQVVLRAVRHRFVADHAEPRHDLVGDALEEGLRWSFDPFQWVKLRLEEFDGLLVVLLCDLRREVVVKSLRVCLHLDVDRDLTLFVHSAHSPDLPLGGEVCPVQVEGYQE